MAHAAGVAPPRLRQVAVGTTEVETTSVEPTERFNPHPSARCCSHQPRLRMGGGVVPSSASAVVWTCLPRVRFGRPTAFGRTTSGWQQGEAHGASASGLADVDLQSKEVSMCGFVRLLVQTSCRRRPRPVGNDGGNSGNWTTSVEKAWVDRVIDRTFGGGTGSVIASRAASASQERTYRIRLQRTCPRRAERTPQPTHPLRRKRETRCSIAEPQTAPATAANLRFVPVCTQTQGRIGSSGAATHSMTTNSTAEQSHGAPHRSDTNAATRTVRPMKERDGKGRGDTARLLTRRSLRRVKRHRERKELDTMSGLIISTESGAQLRGLLTATSWGGD